MDWEAVRDNLGLIIFAAVWVVSLLLRAVRGKGGPASGADGGMGPMARRRRARRRAMILGFVLMAAAVALWELSRATGGQEQMLVRVVAAGLGVFALLAILFAGMSRPGSAVQGAIDLEHPDERAAEISAGEPLEPS